MLPLQSDVSPYYHPLCTTWHAQERFAPAENLSHKGGMLVSGEVMIRLEVYLPFRGKRRWRGEERVPAGTPAGALPALLGLSEPELAVLVNGRYRDESTPLAEGDEVAVLRQAEGG